MRGAKLISLVQALSQEEQSQLISFSKNKLHNSNKRVSACLEILTSSDLSKDIDDESLFQLLFPELNEYNDVKLRDLLYLANKVCKDYIIYFEARSNKTLRRKSFQNFLKKRHLTKNLGVSISKNIKEIEKKKLLSPEDHLELFEQYTSDFVLNEVNNIKFAKEEIQKALHALDNYYIAEKLKWSHELLGSQLDTSQKYDIPLLEEVLIEANKPPYQENQFIAVYYLIALFYKKNFNKAYYNTLKTSILEIFDQISEQERRSLTVDLQNYAINMYGKTGKYEEIEEIHRVDILGLETGAWYKNGKIKFHTMMNIVNVALRLEEFDWVRNCLNEYKSKIDDENNFKLLEAMLFFELGKYDEVRSLLQEVEYSDIYLAMTSKSYLAQTYFMQREFELLDPHLKAMEQFYRRNKILSESLKTNNINFVLTLRKMMKHVNTPSKLTNLLTEIEGVNNMAYKAWIQKIIKLLLT